MSSTSESSKKSRGLLHSLVSHATEVESPASKIYVYEAPVRLWHWVNALCIVLLCVTGYLIAAPAVNNDPHLGVDEGRTGVKVH